MYYVYTLYVQYNWDGIQSVYTHELECGTTCPSHHPSRALPTVHIWRPLSWTFSSLSAAWTLCRCHPASPAMHTAHCIHTQPRSLQCMHGKLTLHITWNCSISSSESNSILACFLAALQLQPLISRKRVNVSLMHFELCKRNVAKVRNAHVAWGFRISVTVCTCNAMRIMRTCKYTYNNNYYTLCTITTTIR